MRKSTISGYRLVCLTSACFLFALLIGCGALDSVMKDSSGALKGVFMDSPVGGLSYATPTQKGVTGADGVFKYQAGETVTFSVGAVKLGSAPGKPVVTPLDLFADAKDASDQRVTNVAVFLQTLDQDGNAQNGILIDEKTASYVTKYGAETNFNKPVRAFSFDGGFRSIMAELNNADAFGSTPRAIKPPFVAQKHLEASLAELKKKETTDKK